MAQQVSAPQSACAPVAQPTGPWLWSQHWLDLFFAHWPVGAADIRPHVAAALDIDTWEGSAWVSLVAFRLERIRQRWLPSVGFLTNSLELNLRTYVRYHGEPAIYFLSLHAGNPLLVYLARWATPLPYECARMSYVWRDGTAQFHTRSPEQNDDRTLAVSFTPVGGGTPARAGSLDAWLLERYCLYVQNKNSPLVRTVVEHAPWAVQDVAAVVTANTMGRPFGLALACEPERAHFSPGVRAHVWPFDKSQKEVNNIAISY
jgi:uncharacterized protein YqjF (DUF2071 family)